MVPWMGPPLEERRWNRLGAAWPRQADADQSGVIEFEEFAKMIERAEAGAIRETIEALKASV